MLFIADHFASKYLLSVKRISAANSLISSPIRIVQISDLHNAEFGKGNKRLISKVRAEQPELILLTGDLVDSGDERTDVAETLIRELCGIAPVYVSPGNHEAGHEALYGSGVLDRYRDAGAVVLDSEWVDIELNGQALRIGGIYGYCLPEKYITSENNGRFKEEAEFTAAFADTERTTLLMCHMPYSWLTHDALEGWDVDFVFCGHVHGGQVRLPFIGGLWAPDQGWFPGRVSGLYLSDDGERTMVLSRGLGSTERLPRVFNVPEIVTVDLVPEG